MRMLKKWDLQGVYSAKTKKILQAPKIIPFQSFWAPSYIIKLYDFVVFRLDQVEELIRLFFINFGQFRNRGVGGDVIVGCRFGLSFAVESIVLFHKNCRFVECIFANLSKICRFYADFD